MAAIDKLINAEVHLSEEIIAYINKLAPANPLTSIEFGDSYNNTENVEANTSASGTRTAAPPITPLLDTYSGTQSDSVFVEDIFNNDENVTYLDESFNSPNYLQTVTFTDGTSLFLNYGVILINTAINITIENRYDVNMVVNEIPIPSQYGIVISGFTPGDEIVPRGSITYTFTAKTTLGIANVLGNFAIKTSLTDIIVHTSITRVQSILYNIPPDRRSYNESYVYSTKIQEAVDRSERRISLMTEPKMKISYSVTFADHDTYGLAFNTLHYGASNIILAQPIWSSLTWMTASTIKSTSVPCDTTERAFVVGEQVLIQTTPFDAVTSTVLGVEPTQITISLALTLAEGSMVVPIKFMKSNTRSGEYKHSADQSIKYSLEEL